MKKMPFLNDRNEYNRRWHFIILWCYSLTEDFKMQNGDSFPLTWHAFKQ